jgi:hypothetical protein
MLIDFGLSFTHGQQVRIFLPGGTDLIAMAEETLVALNIFRKRFTYMIASPGFGITRLDDGRGRE